MSTTTHRNSSTRRFVTFGVASVAGLLAGIAPTSAATNIPTSPVRCAWAVHQLPHTADAVEGWYRSCHQTRLGTPDATEGWLR